MKKEKSERMEWIELPNQECNGTLGEKKNSKYLGILKADTIKRAKIKKKVMKEYFKRTKKILATNVYSRYFIKWINTWAVSLVRYPIAFLKFSKAGLRKNQSKDKKVDEYALGFTNEQWYRLIAKMYQYEDLRAI